MKKTWKKILAAGCAAAMLVTMPGSCVLADEMAEEELIVTEAEVPEETVDSVDSPVEDVTYDVDAPITEEKIDEEEAEEIVGVGSIQVGDGVTATFDADTGAVEFTSQNGELWRDWVDKLGVDKSKIKSIRVESGTVYLPADSSGYYFDYGEHFYLFGGLYNLKSLDLSSFDTSNVTNMRNMFYNCESLTNLDLSSFNTLNVTTMNCMFCNCKSLTNLDLSSFDTSNVTGVMGINEMFLNCKSLTNLDLSSFDTSNVTNMGSMFFGCNSLTNR